MHNDMVQPEMLGGTGAGCSFSWKVRLKQPEVWLEPKASTPFMQWEIKFRWEGTAKSQWKPLRLISNFFFQHVVVFLSPIDLPLCSFQCMQFFRQCTNQLQQLIFKKIESQLTTEHNMVKIGSSSNMGNKYSVQSLALAAIKHWISETTQEFPKMSGKRNFSRAPKRALVLHKLEARWSCLGNVMK